MWLRNSIFLTETKESSLDMQSSLCSNNNSNLQKYGTYEPLSDIFLGHTIIDDPKRQKLDSFFNFKCTLYSSVCLSRNRSLQGPFVIEIFWKLGCW